MCLPSNTPGADWACSLQNNRVHRRDNLVASRARPTYVGRMDEFEGMAQPKCPNCGTVMVDDRRGFWCGQCRHLEDHAAERAAIVIPPEFDGPSIRAG